MSDTPDSSVGRAEDCRNSYSTIQSSSSHWFDSGSGDPFRDIGLIAQLVERGAVIISQQNTLKSRDQNPLGPYFFLIVIQAKKSSYTIQHQPQPQPQVSMASTFSSATGFTLPLRICCHLYFDSFFSVQSRSIAPVSSVSSGNRSNTASHV